MKDILLKNPYSAMCNQSHTNKIPLIKKMKEDITANKSADCLLYGVKGDGKSSAGLGLSYQADDNFDVDHIVFSMEAYLNAIKELPAGSFIVFDETGTQSSGMSSRNFMSSNNKNIVDVWQMARTRQISTICITLDAGRIDNRIRETFKYHVSPIMKLSDADTKGHGLAVVCEIREIVKAKNKDGGESLFSLKATRPQNVSWVSIPLPPKNLIYRYEKKRDEILKELMEKVLTEQAEKENPVKRGRGRPPKQKEKD